MPPRRNVLLLFADQMRFDMLGVRNPAIRTPNLDRLAARGMLLPRAYAPTPVCLPCRTSLLTGQYPSTHRATHNNSSLPEDYPLTLPRLLRDAGYYTHIIGKTHFTCCHDPCSTESAPFIHNREYYRRWHGSYYGFEHADIAIGHSTEAHACGMHYGAWLEDRGVDLAKHFGQTPYEGFGAWDLPEEFHNSAWTAETTIASMQRSREEGRPFFIWSNFQDPHNPCYVPEPWASMYDPATIPLHGFKPGEPDCYADKPPFYREILDIPGPYEARPSDPGLPLAGNVCSLPYTEEEIRKNAACYYGMVSLLDHHVGRILDALDASGQAENTILVFSADHGELLGDHGFWYKSLVTYDESIRVPMIVSCPGSIPAGTCSEAIQNLVDLAPTFLEAAGLGRETAFEGVSQWAAWRDPSCAVREDTVVEERPFGTDFNQRILVTPTHKLAVYANRSWGELYDLEADPHQTRNLYDDPAHRDLRDRLTARILSHEMNKTAPRPSPSTLCRERA